MKVVGIPGGKPKIEEITWISRGSMQKNRKFQRVTVNSNRNAGGINLKKIDIVNRGVCFFSGKAHSSFRSNEINENEKVIHHNCDIIQYKENL